MLDICKKCEILKDEAKLLFNEEIKNLEEDIFLSVEEFRFKNGGAEQLKNDFFNKIVRTKYQECKKYIQKDINIK